MIFARQILILSGAEGEILDIATRLLSYYNRALVMALLKHDCKHVNKN